MVLRLPSRSSGDGLIYSVTGAPRIVTSIDETAWIYRVTPTVQWRRSIDGDTTFTDVAGATDPTLTVSGTQYETVFTNPAETIATNPATLTMQTVPTVTQLADTARPSPDY